MRRLLTGLLLAAVLVGTAGAAQPTRVLSVEWQAGGGKLRWVSPTTLRPLGPAVLNVGGAPADLVAVSPDRAVGAIGGGVDGRLRFVRLDGLRQTGLMRLGEGSVFGGIWDSPSQLVVLLGGSAPKVVMVDPEARRVVSTTQLTGVAMGVVRAGPRLLTLLAPRNTIGPARLVVVGADGSVRTVSLPGIVAGWEPPAAPDGTGHSASPGLAAEGRRAVVVGNESLAVVDLESLAVESRALDTRSTAKRVEGWGRNAVWLRGNRIALAGWMSGTNGTHGIGVSIADVTTGAVRTLDADATAATRAGSTLLVHGGAALHGYRLDGTLRFTILGAADTGYVQTAGRWAYIGLHNSTYFTVVDVVRGSIAGRVRTTKPTVVFSP
jgi:hypothetical protein